MSDLRNRPDISGAFRDEAAACDQAAIRGLQDKVDTPRATALFLSAFFDELARCGVREVVVSPGSRSTPLSMVAFEASKRATCAMKLYLDVDERGAAFFALGLAKASGNPVCLICTSGTAVANYYPAVLEAEASRVPLILLTGDRPPRLQNLGAPQTCDQMKVYGDHVRFFQQMPLPGSRAQEIAFARQMAKTACIHALGSGAAGPVHLNFPFEEPLKPDLGAPDLFEVGREHALRREDATDAAGWTNEAVLPILVDAASQLSADALCSLARIIHDRRTVVLVGEHTLSAPPAQVLRAEDTCAASDEREELLRWAQRFGLPLLADPLSGLRACEDASVIDAYDAIFASFSNAPNAVTSNDSNAFAPNDLTSECPPLSCVIRFGRYPISKRCVQAIAAQRPFQIVVDPVDTLDFNSATYIFVRCEPMDFVRALTAYADKTELQPHEAQLAYRDIWVASNAAARRRCATALQAVAAATETSEKSAAGATERLPSADTAVSSAADLPLEAATVAAVLKLIPDHSCIFAANSMAVRLVDAVYQASSKPLVVLCNRGLNGIDGTLSSALGAAQHFSHTTLITGDLSMLHDINALALQRELLQHHAGKNRQKNASFNMLNDSEPPVASNMSVTSDTSAASNIVIVLLNNNGGGIFDMLPQRSDEDYFERLFLTPQDVDFAHAAAAFHIPYHLAESPDAFADAYQAALSRAGISIVEVRVPIAGLRERMGRLL